MKMKPVPPKELSLYAFSPVNGCKNTPCPFKGSSHDHVNYDHMEEMLQLLGILIK
jgi:hypothetical protein